MIKITDNMLSSEDAIAEALAREGHSEISDAAARTIAGMWASPGRVGSVLAALSTGVEVDVSELLEDISRTFATDDPQGDESIALGMLATWAINHPSR